MGLAESMHSIAENIKTSHNLRVNELGKLIVDTQNTLKRSAADRKKMSTEQAKDLNNFKHDLSNDVTSMLNGFQKKHGETSKEVTSMLNGFQNKRGEMSKELKTKLTNEINAIQTNVKNLLKEFNGNHNAMSAALKKMLSKFSDNLFNDVKKLIGDYNSDRMKAKSHWQKMSLDMAKARENGNGKKLNVLAGEKAFVAESPSKNSSTKPKEKKTQKKEVE